MYSVVSTIFFAVTYLVTAMILGVVGLVLLQLIFQMADVNPFSKPALWLRRLSDPLLQPARLKLRMMGVEPKFAPLAVILVTILLGYFAIQLAESIAVPLQGIVWAVQSKAPVHIIGYIIYGALSVFYLILFMRFILSWIWSPYENKFMLFLVRATNPVLEPLRRLIPPFGRVDLSFFLAPLILFLMINLLQNAVAVTLLRGAPLKLFV